MSHKTQVALRKQLYRELKHKRWLNKHLHGTKQHTQCLKRILVLRTQLTQHTHEYSAR